jgi:hypothetical protein
VCFAAISPDIKVFFPKLATPLISRCGVNMATGATTIWDGYQVTITIVFIPPEIVFL